MATLNWQGVDWTFWDEGWEIIHPEKPYNWHDSECVNVDDEGILHLASKQKKATFDFATHYEKSSPIAVGGIRSKKGFSYGYFEVVCKFPVGDYMWPAFWLSGVDSWPPEIDVVEGYSGKKASYWNIKPWKLKFWPLWHVNTDLHYKNPGMAKSSIKAKTHWIGWKSPAKRFNTYAVDWQENYVRWYYNGRKVREITRRSILKTFVGAEMYVIINNHINKKTDTKNHKPTDFIVKSFTYRRTK